MACIVDNQQFSVVSMLSFDHAYLLLKLVIRSLARYFPDFCCKIEFIFPLSFEIMELRGVLEVIVETHQQKNMAIGVLGWILREHRAAGDHKILLEGTPARMFKV